VGHRADRRLEEEPVVSEQLVLDRTFSTTCRGLPTKFAPRSAVEAS